MFFLLSELAPNEISTFVCEKGGSQEFLVRLGKTNVLRIFVIINSSSENFEVLVSRTHTGEKNAEMSFKTNRFFIKYRNFSELNRIFLTFLAKERMKYEISLKFISGFQKK